MCSRPRTVFLMALVVMSVTACSGGGPERYLDVAPRVDLPESVAWSAPFQVEYGWEPGTDFNADGKDYLVFVHFLNDRGEVVAQDDHEPSLPTSEWQPGQAVAYERWFRFIKNPESEHLDVVVGLYDDAGRVVTSTSEGRSDYPILARLPIRLDDDRGMPVRGGGWYELERSDTTGELWHWMSDEATAVFLNPRHDAFLHMEASAPTRFLGGAQRGRVMLGDVEIGTFALDDENRVNLIFPVDSADMGDGWFLEFTIQVEEAVIPSEVDPDSDILRRLGLKVFYLHLSSGDPS